MGHLQNRIAVTLGAVAVLGIAAPRHAAGPSREPIIDLGVLGSDTHSFAWDVNERGEVAGYSYTVADGQETGQHAWRWRNGTLTPLPSLGGEESIAYSISANGVVGGDAQHEDGARHAVVWTRNGRVREMPELEGSSFSYVTAYNQHTGDAFGTAGMADGTYRAVRWKGRRVKDLGTLAGDTYSDTWDANSRNQAVGNSGDTPDENEEITNSRAFLWQNGRMRELPALSEGGQSLATNINERGVIAGFAQAADGRPRAVRWRRGQINELELPDGTVASTAYGINDRGHVVGTAFSLDESNEPTIPRATLWRGGEAIDLNTLLPEGSGWVLLGASAINGRGQIVAFGVRDGQHRAVLLNL